MAITLEAASGDAALINATRSALGNRGSNKISVVYIHQDTDGELVARHAYFGSDIDRQYEIGSISKVYWGHVFADFVERGLVAENARLDQCSPFFVGKTFGAITLVELATHTAGLPKQPALSGSGDPFAPYNKQKVQEHAQSLYRSTNRGKYSYSNIGPAVLGHALADIVGIPARQLLFQEFTTRAGLFNTDQPELPVNLPPNAPTGYAETGFWIFKSWSPVVPWCLNGYAPAGGIRTNAVDMEEFLKSMLYGELPGMTAIDARKSVPSWAGTGTAQVTLGGWYLEQNSYVPGKTLLYKDGNTGGFAAACFIDFVNNEAVYIAANTDPDIDRVAANLIKSRGGLL